MQLFQYVDTQSKKIDCLYSAIKKLSRMGNIYNSIYMAKKNIVCSSVYRTHRSSKQIAGAWRERNLLTTDSQIVLFKFLAKKIAERNLTAKPDRERVAVDICTV